MAPFRLGREFTFVLDRLLHPGEMMIQETAQTRQRRIAVFHPHGDETMSSVVAVPWANFAGLKKSAGAVGAIMWPMKRALLTLLFTLFAAAAASAPPETVAITYRVSAVNEAALRAVIEGHRATLEKLDLVSGPHHLYRGDGFFLEIFTWKDAEIPDHAPAEVLEWWKKMNALVVKDGLRIDEIHRVEASK